MKSSKAWFCLAAVLLALTSLSARPALADTYQIFNLGSDEGYFVYGMSSTGEVIISYDTPGDNCVTSARADCFSTFVNGVDIGDSSTPPPMTSDEGAPCTPSTPSGVQARQGFCNNGHEVFTTYSAFPEKVYTGTDPTNLTLVGQFPEQDLIYIDSEGDVVWADTLSEFWFEAIDETNAPPTPVPEPTTLTLLATGLAATAGAIRRRLNS